MNATHLRFADNNNCYFDPLLSVLKEMVRKGGFLRCNFIGFHQKIAGGFSACQTGKQSASGYCVRLYPTSAAFGVGTVGNTFGPQVVQQMRAYNADVSNQHGRERHVWASS